MSYNTNIDANSRELLKKYLLNLAPDLSVFSMLETAVFQKNYNLKYAGTDNKTDDNNYCFNDGIFFYYETDFAERDDKSGDIFAIESIELGFYRALIKVVGNTEPVPDTIYFKDCEVLSFTSSSDKYEKYYIVYSNTDIDMESEVESNAITMSLSMIADTDKLPKYQVWGVGF